MIKIRTLPYVLVLSILVAIACTGESADPVIYTDPADTVRVAVGEQFKISLQSNPTTGYKWQFMTPPDSILLNMVEDEYVPDSNPEKLVGRGGHAEWLFEPLAEGATTVSMQYLRPWDSTSVERTVEFRIEIEDK